MKTVLAGVLVAGVLVGATPGTAATPLERRVTTLQRQVTTLQKQVKTLQKQARDNRSIALSALGIGICVTAITGDALQGTWSVINQVAGRTVFAAPQTLNDRGVCGALRVPRQPTLVPPTISPFAALLALVSQAIPVERLLAARAA